MSVSSVLTISVTVCGDLGGRKPILRSGAQPGDVLAYAGDLGLAGLGLKQLFTSPKDKIHKNLLVAQLRPQPPLHLGVLAHDSGAHAGLDVSDSLVKDAGRIARASSVSIHLDEKVIDQYAGELAATYGIDAAITRQAILFGGEDHGLLMTFPQTQSLPEGFTVLGSVGEGPAEVYLGEASVEQKGWDPYAWSGDIT